MSDDIVIRRALPDDWASLRDIRLESLKLEPTSFSAHFDDFSDYQEADWRSRLDSTRGPIFLAFDSGQVVGIVGFNPSANRNSLHRANLGGVYVRASYRGTGLAQRLLEAAHVDAKTRGLTLIEISVNRSNERADKFYVGQGYKDVGVLKGALICDGQVFDEIFMYKEL